MEMNLLGTLIGAVGWLVAAAAPSGDLAYVRSFGRFSDAQALAVDPSGNCYVVEARERQILKTAPDGRVLARWGGYAWSGEGADLLPDVAAPNGIDVYAADYGNHRVIRFDRNLNVVSSFSGVSEGSGERLFAYVRSVAVTPRGTLLIVDGENDRVVEIEGNSVRRIIGGLDAGAGRLRKPRTVRTGRDEEIDVLEARGVVRFDAYGTFLGLGSFPYAQAMTTADTSVYVADSCAIVRWISGSALVERFRWCGTDTSTMTARAIAVRNDSLYVLTATNIRVYSRERHQQ